MAKAKEKNEINEKEKALELAIKRYKKRFW